MRLLLIMRKSVLWHADHIATLRMMGRELHLLTEVPGLETDGRFAAVTLVPAGRPVEEVAADAVALAEAAGIGTALTFAETDIHLTSVVNERLGNAWAAPEADAIARDKRRQREFLADQGIPTVGYAAVADTAEALAAAERLGYPLIVKPTHAAFSRGVALVAGPAELADRLGAIERMARSGEGNYFTGRERTFALLEEFLPGEEVTLDGVVLFGRFHLAGIINKMHMPGPYFEEDFYTLPFRTPELEPGLTAIAESITKGLQVEHCLFNVELRQDREGRFRVVEFSTRMSGGQNYHNLREVHGIDVVRLFAKALTAGDPAQVWEGEVRRLPPRRATCITYAYRTGLLLRNTPGQAALSPYFQSYVPVARPGDRLRRAPAGYDIAGSLSVNGPYREPADLDRIEAVAAELDGRLDVLVVPAAGDTP
ncbi:ATP-grasp domain-containing protein [Actinacidiphila sp. ITFR-21]|uniref:ATP-grasp domain-containing protein n=1 Tax=Actinacidiphila sp. ITFR-21 TaxID=3075199 RepID=UPI00288AC057|nr:ATP-grasp domain-containing protein [Streptomyces sp. ITFR-21]WNI14311.1 ATP-grasp domain-containing protein [Streptomyces sp. ITFR-21]